MKVTIEQDGCLGCGLCYEICPEVFRLGENNLAVAGAVQESAIPSLREAERLCPMGIIHVATEPSVAQRANWLS